MEKGTASKKIKLKTSDGKELQVPEELALQFLPVRRKIETEGKEGPVLLPDITAPILIKVIAYCKKHAAAEDASRNAETTKDGGSTVPGSSRMFDKKLSDWDKKFVKVDLRMLYDIINAAHCMGINGLQDLAFEKVLNMRKEGAAVDLRQIRKAIQIVTDFTAGMKDENCQRKITLESDDGELFIVPESVAAQSVIIRFMIEDDCAQDPIPLPNVSAETLRKVIEYCLHHSNAADASATETAGKSSSATPGSSSMSKEELSNWDKQFVNVDLRMLFDLINAANYLEIQGLLDLTTQEVANIVMGKTTEGIRRTFNIKNDFTADEEQKLRQEFKWFY